MESSSNSFVAALICRAFVFFIFLINITSLIFVMITYKYINKLSKTQLEIQTKQN